MADNFRYVCKGKKTNRLILNPVAEKNNLRIWLEFESKLTIMKEDIP